MSTERNFEIRERFFPNSILSHLSKRLISSGNRKPGFRKNRHLHQEKKRIAVDFLNCDATILKHTTEGRWSSPEPRVAILSATLLMTPADARSGEFGYSAV